MVWARVAAAPGTVPDLRSGQNPFRWIFFFSPFFKAQEVMCGGCGRCAALTARPGAAGGNVWGAREELVSSSPHLLISSQGAGLRRRGHRTGPRALVTPPGQTPALSRREQQQCEGGGSGFIFSFPNKLFCRAALLSCPAVGKAKPTACAACEGGFTKGDRASGDGFGSAASRVRVTGHRSLPWGPGSCCSLETTTPRSPCAPRPASMLMSGRVRQSPGGFAPSRGVALPFSVRLSFLPRPPSCSRRVLAAGAPPRSGEGGPRFPCPGVSVSCIAASSPA